MVLFENLNLLRCLSVTVPINYGVSVSFFLNNCVSGRRLPCFEHLVFARMLSIIPMHDIDVQNGPSLVVTQIAVDQCGL